MIISLTDKEKKPISDSNYLNSFMLCFSSNLIFHSRKRQHCPLLNLLCIFLLFIVMIVSSRSTASAKQLTYDDILETISHSAQFHPNNTYDTPTPTAPIQLEPYIQQELKPKPPTASIPRLHLQHPATKSPNAQQYRHTTTLTYIYVTYSQGRWPSRDPIEEKGGVNLYAFSENDGINYWDELGKDRFKGQFNYFEDADWGLSTWINLPNGGDRVKSLDEMRVTMNNKVFNGEFICSANKESLTMRWTEQSDYAELIVDLEKVDATIEIARNNQMQYFELSKLISSCENKV